MCSESIIDETIFSSRLTKAGRSRQSWKLCSRIVSETDDDGRRRLKKLLTDGFNTFALVCGVETEGKPRGQTKSEVAAREKV